MQNLTSKLSPGWRLQGDVLFQLPNPNSAIEYRRSADGRINVDRLTGPNEHSFAVGIYRDDGTAVQFALSANAARELLATSNPVAEFYGRVEVSQGRFEFVRLNQPEHWKMLTILQTWH